MDRTAELHADAPNSATAVGGTESYAALPDLCRLPGTAPVAPEQSSRAGPRADRPIAMDGPGAQTRLWTVPPLGAGRHVLRAAVGGRLSVPVAKKAEGVCADGRVAHRALVAPHAVDASSAGWCRPRYGCGRDQTFGGSARAAWPRMQLLASDAHEVQGRGRPVLAPMAALHRPVPRDALWHCPKDLQQLIGAAIRPIFRAGNLEVAGDAGGDRYHLRRVPTVARLPLEAVTDLLAYYSDSWRDAGMSVESSSLWLVLCTSRSSMVAR
jgi:hypothetical protein